MLDEATLIEEDFYFRPVIVVAKALLGMIMVSFISPGVTAAKIVETEAYLGPGDDASHSARGRTPRNSVMFGPAGKAYVYQIYGVHFCFNVTADKDDIPAAVLVRAAEPIKGIELMSRRRKRLDLRDLCSGPGKVAQAMGITKDINGRSVIKGPVRFYYPQVSLLNFDIVSTKRIGISTARELPLRFYIKDCNCISCK